jgi:hypothetical protein
VARLGGREQGADKEGLAMLAETVSRKQQRLEKWKTAQK